MPLLPLSEAPPGAEIYIDANILIYAMLGESEECRAFLARCEADVFGYSDVRVLHDAAHRLMLADAAQLTGKPQNHKTLKANPSLVRGLTRWQPQVLRLCDLPIEWIAVSAAALRAVPEVATETGLLCGDALHAAIMRVYGLTTIATNDPDFASAGLTAYCPSDV